MTDVDDNDNDKSLRGRMAKGGEETIGKFAQDLLESPLVSGALSAVFETRERATRAQEVAMGALNLPSASDIERLTRRLRGLSQRIEGLEDGLDGIQDRLDKLGASNQLDIRLAAIEASLTRIEAALASGAPEAAPAPVMETAADRVAAAAESGEG